MAGGTFTSQNKIRPGAYINFKGVAKPMSALGERGVVAIPMPLSWGPKVSEVLSTELADGTSADKIGLAVFDEEAILLREALKHAYKAVVFRVDYLGGTKATATQEPLTVTAKYAGVYGNRIQVTASGPENEVVVTTLVGGVEKDKQVVAQAEELKDNAWVVFEGEGDIPPSALLTLAGGTNGTVAEGAYSEFLTAIDAYHWDAAAIPVKDSTDWASIVKRYRDDQGRKVQLVVLDTAEKHEGIINVTQGYTTEYGDVSPAAFTAYVAGLAAGTPINESNTYHVVQGATGIIYPEGEPFTHDDIVDRLQQGHFILSTRSDGAVVVEQDINTFTEFTPDKGYAFSKNRVIRVLDGINNDIKRMFESRYIGRVNNDADGRNIFKADVIAYLNTLQGIGAIQNFNSETDIQVLPGEQIDSVVAELAVQPVDAMEKLYMTVIVR